MSKGCYAEKRNNLFYEFNIVKKENGLNIT